MFSHLKEEIVYHDDAIVVVNKPSGLLAIPGRGPQKADSISSRMALRFPQASGPLMVHRLDMATSGLMVLGLSPQSQRDLSIQFERREVDKVYHAVVGGIIEADGGRIELPFRLDPDNRPHQVYDEENGKWGETLWRVLSRNADSREVSATLETSGDVQESFLIRGPHCMLEFKPITGRTHQLRLHSAHQRGLGSAILGDKLYGDPTTAPRLLLHAKELSFNHPDTGERVEFNSPPPF